MTIDQWLVRTSANQLLGPFPKELLCQMIRDGKFGPQDEVCGASHYWIYLHETDEVVRQLGIEPPRRLRSDDEITETQTQTQTKTETDLERTDPDLRRQPTGAEPKTQASAKGEATGDSTVMYKGSATAAPARPNVPPAAAENPQRPTFQPHPTQSSAQLQGDLHSAQATSLPESNQGNPSKPTVIYRPMVLGDIQQPSVWRVIAIILVALTIGIVMVILGQLQ